MAKKPLEPRNPPWLPSPYDKTTVTALQALAAGEANEGQQQRALDWIISVAAGTYEPSFYDDNAGGERNTAFAEGRRSVGLQVVKLLKMPISQIKD